MKGGSVIRWGLVAAVLLALGGTATARADNETALPLTGFTRMVVDGANGHVFVTGSVSDSQIAVMNDDGTLDTTITGEAGAAGMVLDSGTLYVARCDGSDEIDEISTTSLTRTGSFSAPVGGSCDLAEAGGRLWFTTAGSPGDVESVSLDSSHTVVAPTTPIPGNILASSPGAPDTLVSGTTGATPVAVDVLDVTDPANPGDTHVSNPGGGTGMLHDLAVTPDGDTLLIAAGSPSTVKGFTLPGLTAAAGSYPIGGAPDAVAVSPDGTKVAAGQQGSGTDAAVYPAGTSTPTVSFDFGAASDQLYPRGLAFSSDGATLFAVSGSSGTAFFHALVANPTGTLTISASTSTIDYPKGLTLTVHLGTSSTNKTVSVYHRPASGGSNVLQETGQVNSAGNLVLKVSPGRDTRYSATWSGDSQHAATNSNTVRVNVEVVTHAETLGGYATSSGGYRLYHYQTSCVSKSHTLCPRFRAWAVPTSPGATFNWSLQEKIGSAWKGAGSGSEVAGSDGTVTLLLFYSNRNIININTRIRFTMRNTTTNLGSTSPWVYFRITS